jgi:hypothetical protein
MGTKETVLNSSGIIDSFVQDNPTSIVAMKIFLTITVILLVLSVIPLTKDLARGALKHKYRITAMWLWRFTKIVFSAHMVLYAHLTKDKDDIFTSLEKTLKKEEDKLRNRIKK